MVNYLAVVASALSVAASVKGSALPEPRAADIICKCDICISLSTLLTMYPCTSGPQASRFGNLLGLPSPASLTTGQSYTVTHDYACAFYFGQPPTFTDYVLQVTANGNGHQAPILVTRRTPQVTAAQPSDTFTFTVPFGYYLATASYALTTVVTFPVNGTNGTPVLQQGGVLNGVAIVDTSVSN